MTDFESWKARGVTHISVLQGDLYDGDEDVTVGKAGQTQIICDDAEPCVVAADEGSCVLVETEEWSRLRQCAETLNAIVPQYEKRIASLKAENKTLRGPGIPRARCKHCREGEPLLALGDATTVRVEHGSLVLESYGARAVRAISRCPACGARIAMRDRSARR